MGWPLGKNAGGGSFIYHLENNQIYIGFVVHLNYKNPHLFPYMEFQRFKHHPKIKKLLEGGKQEFLQENLRPRARWHAICEKPEGPIWVEA